MLPTEKLNAQSTFEENVFKSHKNESKGNRDMLSGVFYFVSKEAAMFCIL
jgi:hypothetical protein